MTQALAGYESSDDFCEAASQRSGHTTPLVPPETPVYTPIESDDEAQEQRSVPGDVEAVCPECDDSEQQKQPVRGRPKVTITVGEGVTLQRNCPCHLEATRRGAEGLH